MRIEDLTSYENNKSKVTVFMQVDKSGDYYFLKHIEDKVNNTEKILEYSLEMFMAEYYLIENFIKGNLVKDRKFFKQVLNLKASRNE